MGGLAHRALIYSSPDDFVSEMAPFVRDGLDRGDEVFAATTPVNIAALREELGDAGAQVRFENTLEWCVRPYERLQEFGALVNGLPEGRSLSAMGEPVWAGSQAMIRQWARYESVINTALAHAPMRFVCLYDGSSLPDRILDYALHTHPEQVAGGGVSPSAAFVAPEEFLPGEPAGPPATAAEVPLDGAADFRRALSERATSAGLAGRRLEDFVFAANEVASNALVHGRPPLRADTWIEDGELVCRIADAGGRPLPLTAGWQPPAAGGGGWGLPLARQLCDVVELAGGPEGTVVSLHMALDGAAS